MDWDARSQLTAPHRNLFDPQRQYCVDLAPYWCARYELERRRNAELQPGPPGPVIGDRDSIEEIARKLADYGYRRAAQRCHPDHGGSHEVWIRLMAAKNRLLAAANGK
jgi:hypothetical protein